MSGPIVRTGATPKFWENWDRVFGNGKKKKAGGKKTASAKAAHKKSGKASRKAAGKSGRKK